MTGAAVKAFEVLTEFRFDIAGAVASTDTLTQKVGNLTAVAEEATASLTYLGGSFLSSMGLSIPGMGGSLLGFFGTAAQAAEKAQDSALTFANIIAANKDKLTGPINSFNDRLRISERIMLNIGEQAREFALPEMDLLNMTKLLSVPLINKGLAGKDMDVAIDIGRNLLKAAPSLQLHPAEIEGQLMRLMEGAASSQDTLFRRLAMDTDAMRPFLGKGGAQKFNTKDAAERVDLLRRALGQFTADVNVVKMRTESLTAQIQVLKDQLTGVNSVLIPLGRQIRSILVQSLQYVNQTIAAEGRALMASAARLTGGFLESPKQMITNLLQLRELSNDLHRTGASLSFGGSVMGIAWILGKVFRIAALGNPIIGGLAMSFHFLFGAINRVDNPILNLVATMIKWAVGIALVAAVLAKFGVLGAAITLVFKGILLPMLVMMTLSQIISRAVAKARIADAEALPMLITRLTWAFESLVDSLAPVVRPFMDMVDSLATAIMPIFRVTTWGELLITFLYKLADAIRFFALGITGWLAAFSGVMEGFLNVILKLQEFSFMDVLSGDANLGEAFTSGFKQEFMRYLNKANQPGKPDENGNVLNTSSHVTNIGKVEVRQDFKENMEPDRIAASFVKVIGEIGRNPTQAQGRSFSGALSR